MMHHFFRGTARQSCGRLVVELVGPWPLVGEECAVLEEDAKSGTPTSRWPVFAPGLPDFEQLLEDPMKTGRLTYIKFIMVDLGSTPTFESCHFQRGIEFGHRMLRYIVHHGPSYYLTRC